MEQINFSPLLLIGCFLLAGYVAHAVGSRTHIPRVILLLLLGVVASPGMLDLVPEDAAQWLPRRP